MTRPAVAFYAPWAGPNLTPGQEPSGGAEVQMLLVARGLARRGAGVVVATYDVPGLPHSVDGARVVAQWRPDWTAALPRRAAVVASSMRVLRSTRARTYVQRASGGTTGLVGIASRLNRARFVYSSASTDDFAVQGPGRHRVTRWVYELGIRLADEIVVQSDEQAQMCRDRFGREPVVIRSIAEPAAPRPELRDSDGFLWIGRIVPYKNPLAFLDLAALMPTVPFTMVCVPGPDLELLDRVRALGESLANVEMVGPQRRPALMERIAGATAIVSTSDFEGMPNTLLEGWSRCVPALTLRHDPDGLIAAHGLGRTAGGDPALLHRQALELWAGRDDPALGQRCLDYVRTHHDPEAVVRRWEAVLGLPGAPARDADPSEATS